MISILRTRRVLSVTMVLGLLTLNSAASESPATDGAGSRIIAGPLDGLTFVGALGPSGKPKDTADRFVFENGTFVSKECELRCEYPARPYFTRVDGDRIEFISETRCPYKDATIVWRGTVENGRISGHSSWMARRWYWTVETTFEFEGELVATTSAPD